MSKQNYTLSNMSKQIKTSKSAGGMEAMTDRLIPTGVREFDKLEQHLGCDLSDRSDVPAGEF